MTARLSHLIPDVEPRVSRAGESQILGLRSRPDPFYSPVVIRMATALDRRSLERLAQLDSARAPAGPTLIGEVQGQPVVAVSLADGHAIADPFVAARPIVELVRLRAGQLRPKARSVQAWPSRRRP